MRQARWCCTVFCWLGVVGHFGTAFAAEPAATGRLNVLLLVSDDQRPDTIAALGNKIIRTPNLDRLVRRGTAFTRAIAPDPVFGNARGYLKLARKLWG